jgi:hypothetical protein
MARGTGRAVGRRLRGPWSAPSVLLALACALILALFATNSDMGGDPSSPRGDGRYRPVLARGDGHMLFLMARSTAFDGDWRWDNDLARFGDPWSQRRTPTGRKGVPHPIGPALIWTPVLWLAQAGAVVVNLVGAEVPLHGYTAWHQRIVFFTSVLFAWGVAFLARAVARRWIGGRWAPTYGAVAVLLGTSVTYYATHMPSYGHAMDAFLSSAFLALWALTVGRTDVRRFVGLGGLLGLAALVRNQELALGVVVAVEILGRLIGVGRGVPGALPEGARPVGFALRLVGLGALTLAIALLVFTPQLAAWRVVHGAWLALPQGPHYTRWDSPLWMETLFSARNGFLSMHPIAYLGLLGLAALPRRSRLIAIGFVAAAFVEIYLCSIIYDWWGSASFGQRRLCNLSVPIAVGLAALLWRAGGLVARWRRVPRGVWHGVAVIGLGWFVAWNLAQVMMLRKGKAASGELRASCCQQVPAPMRAIAQPIYDAIGNPFALPASALFAAKYGVPLRRWDSAVGVFPLVPGLDDFLDGSWQKQRAVWDPADGGRAPFLLRGWGPIVKAAGGERRYRWTTAPRAEMLVPLLMPDGVKIAVWVHPGAARAVRLVWDDQVVAAPALTGGWQLIGFSLPRPQAGTHRLAIESDVGPAPAGALPVPAMPVGVAVGAIELSFLPARP